MLILRIALTCVGVSLGGTVLFAQEPNVRTGPVSALGAEQEFDDSTVQSESAYSPANYQTADAASEYVQQPYYYEEPASGSWFQWPWTKKQTSYMKWRKAPHQKYNHHPTDLGDRPSVPPYCAPTWGYHETCWRQFPTVPRCPDCNVTAKNAGARNPDLINAGVPITSRYVAQQKP